MLPDKCERAVRPGVGREPVDHAAGLGRLLDQRLGSEAPQWTAAQANQPRGARSPVQPVSADHRRGRGGPGRWDRSLDDPPDPHQEQRPDGEGHQGVG
eukprot:3327434-Rhodomonas_salina.2